MPNDTVAVTGATGFTGGALARRLAADGYVVRALARDPAKLPAKAIAVPVSGDLSDIAKLRELVDGCDTVFHVAAMYRSEGSYDDFLKVNLEGTKKLLRACREAKVRRFVHCSTIGVHGSVDETPASESAKFSPRDAYQETKLLAEEHCREEMSRGGIEIVIIRPCAIYGPGDLRMLKMFRMVAKGSFFFVGNGRPNFHPVYIDDLVQGFLLAMRSSAAAGNTYIIGGPNYLPLTAYVAAAARAVGAKPPTLRVPYLPMHLLAHLTEMVCAPLGVEPPLHRRRLTFFKHNRAFSTQKAQTDLAYRPSVDLDEGFARTVEWYRGKGLLPSR